jgi:hypothetical protein
MSTVTPRHSGPRRWRGALTLMLAAAVVAGCTQSQGTATSTTIGHDRAVGVEVSAELARAALATAAFQDESAAEAAGYESTMDSLGCFHSAEAGGMGLHYLRGDLMDGTVDVATPEALVYELNGDGEIAGLVAHEYIIPVEAWTADEPPNVAGVEMHQHPVLPLWVLHAWIWKDNPSGMFEDFNPKVRLCPDGVPIFGVDLP